MQRWFLVNWDAATSLPRGFPTWLQDDRMWIYSAATSCRVAAYRGKTLRHCSIQWHRQAVQLGCVKRGVPAPRSKPARTTQTRNEAASVLEGLRGKGGNLAGAIAE
jgi:hypothetical protein